MLTLAQGMGEDALFLCHRDVPLFDQARSAGHRVQALEHVNDLAEYFRRDGVDTVHVHAGIGWEGHKLAIAAKQAGCRVVRTEHLPWLLDDPAQVDEYRREVEAVDRLIGVSQAVTNSYCEAEAFPCGITTIPNGVDPVDTRDTGLARCALGLGPDPVLLHVGRFSEQKNHHLLLDAFAIVLREYPRAQLLLVGEGEGCGEIARRVGREFSTAVRLLGQRSDVPDLLGSADLLLLPSRFEGLSLVMLEAMSAGLPVVATHTSGIGDVVDENSAWLAEPGRADDLARAVSEALGDRAERERRATNARKLQQERFSAERMRRDTRVLYAGSARVGETRERTRLGFIGAGGIAARHLDVLRAMDDVEVVAFADPDLALAETRSREVGAQAFGSLDAMLETIRLDAAYVCVPPFAHGDAERALIERNIPFFVEKPIALDSGAAQPLADSVTERGLVTAVGYHWRYLDAIDDLPCHLEGRSIRLASGYWLASTPPPPWWRQRAKSGGQMVEQATHLVDLARHLFGDAELVFGLAEQIDRKAYPGLDIPTVSTASIRFAEGVIANFAATCLLEWDHRVGLHLFGEGIAIELTDRDVMVDIGQGRPAVPNRTDPVWREDRDFIDAVRGGENRVRCTYADALETLKLVEAIERSAASGEVVKVKESDI